MFVVSTRNLVRLNRLIPLSLEKKPSQAPISAVDDDERVVGGSDASADTWKWIVRVDACLLFIVNLNRNF